MDFLMNAAKIAQDVQGKKKKKDEGEGGGSSGGGGFGDLIGGFMGGDKPKPKRDEDYDEDRPSKPKPKPRRDEDEYDEEKPHKAGAEGKKKPSTGELFGSAQVRLIEVRFP